MTEYLWSCTHHAIWGLEGRKAVDTSTEMLIYISVLWYFLVDSNCFSLRFPFKKGYVKKYENKQKQGRKVSPLVYT